VNSPERPRTLHSVREDAFNYVWDNAIDPALEVEPGAVVELHVRDASDEQIHADSGPEDVTRLDFDHVNPVSGPVFVKGAQPGDVLVVELLEFHPPDWGWTALIPGFGLLADEFPEPWLRISTVDAAARTVAFADGITLPYEPFPGTIGVALPEPGEHPILPPSRWGGNLDVKHLRVGTTLLLPVGVEGALFSVGDTHAAMGDGEVCGTAVEAPMEIAVRLSVRRDQAPPAPQFHVPAGELARTEPGSYHVCTGVGPDLMEVTRDATRAAIEHVVERYGRSREEAYALLSVAADLRIHEVVDAPNWVVGCFVPEAVFDAQEGR
jgi:acetamidase/formamidase